MSRAHRTRLLDPPPWRTRVHWRFTRAVDGVGCWLVVHVSARAGEWWWRALRVW